MNEKKIQMRLEQLEKTDPRILRKILEILLRSSLGRVLDILLFGDMPSPNIPIDKKNERTINTLSVVGGAVFWAQIDLLEENEILNFEQDEMLKKARNKGGVNFVSLDGNYQLGEMQKREMELLTALLRLEIDFSCGTGTIGLSEENISIKEGFQITVPIDPEGKVVPFPAQP